MEKLASIEYFHLSLCQQLVNKVDRNLFTLKGGCNLRFYFNSFRYSEDIDFDVKTISVATLQKQVNKILESEIFKGLLKSKRDIEIVNWSDPKQTETTQRWKVQIKIPNESLPIPTKIEFSRRNNDFSDAKTEYINPEIVSNYKMLPLLMQHYPLFPAIHQKIGALINRTETQARDVIDLKILKDLASKDLQLKLSLEQKQKALETLISVTYDQYKSQVWPYLTNECQDVYKDESPWNQIQEEVISFIEAAGKAQ